MTSAQVKQLAGSLASWLYWRYWHYRVRLKVHPHKAMFDYFSGPSAGRYHISAWLRIEANWNQPGWPLPAGLLTLVANSCYSSLIRMPLRTFCTCTCWVVARQPAMVVTRQQGPCPNKRAWDARMCWVCSRCPRSALATSILSNPHQMWVVWAWDSSVSHNAFHLGQCEQ